MTPFELEVALQAEPRWEGTYVLDFTRLLADAQQAQPLSTDGPPDTGKVTQDTDTDADGGEDDPEQPTFSLVTGTYRHAKTFGRAESGGGRGSGDGESAGAVILRNQDEALAVMEDSAAGAFSPVIFRDAALMSCVMHAGRFLAQRTYQGLELRLGEDAPGALEQGRSGIARGYQDDRVHQDML